MRKVCGLHGLAATKNWPETFCGVVGLLSGGAMTFAVSYPGPVPHHAVIYDTRAGTTNLARALAIVERGRASHEHWAQYLRSGTATREGKADAAGDAFFHDEWVADYDHLAAVLTGQIDPHAEFLS